MKAQLRFARFVLAAVLLALPACTSKTKDACASAPGTISQTPRIRVGELLNLPVAPLQIGPTAVTLVSATMKGNSPEITVVSILGWNSRENGGQQITVSCTDVSQHKTHPISGLTMQPSGPDPASMVWQLVATVKAERTGRFNIGDLEITSKAGKQTESKTLQLGGQVIVY